ncbi:hypothetical protein [Roseovarius carneus]|nr:hypothetical protein [Roseovarius carneus]
MPNSSNTPRPAAKTQSAGSKSSPKRAPQSAPRQIITDFASI